MANNNQSQAETWLEKHGDYLFSFAFLKVKDTHRAEDLVQETLLAAITAEKTFSNKSSIRTWLTGILKHKIIDHFRRQDKEMSISELIDQDDTDNLEQFFDTSGHWLNKPAAFISPESATQQTEFLEIFMQCMTNLKPRQAEVFLAKEIHGMSNQEICKDLMLNPTNVWILMHRARLTLSNCLKSHQAK